MLWHRTRHFPFRGSWHHYYYNFDPEDPVMHHETWTVTTGFRHRYRVEADDARTVGPDYFGHMEIMKGYAIFHLRGKRHEEYVVEMFPIPIPGPTISQVGVALAQDFRGRPSVNAVLLSSVPLEESVVREKLQQGTKVAAEDRAMRVKT